MGPCTRRRLEVDEAAGAAWGGEAEVVVGLSLYARLGGGRAVHARLSRRLSREHCVGWCA
eukprot:6181471-Pleurochrysis_carterae.AAC.2